MPYSSRYDSDEANRRVLSRSGFGFNDHPDDGIIGVEDLRAQKHQYAQKDWELQQAQAQGVISSEEYAEAKGTDHSTWLQKLTGQKNENNTGSFLEGLGDVFLMPNHFIASVAHGATEGAKDNAYSDSLLAPSVGFSTGAFRDAWRNKKSFIQLFDENGVFNNNYFGLDEDTANFTFGLVADIALDPTSYLTLGSSAGAKVTVSQGARAASGSEKLVGAGQTLTQTPFGKAMFDFAAQRLSPQLHAEVLAHGGLDGKLVAAQYAKITDHLVQNFPTLQKEYLAQISNGTKWNKIKRVIAPAGEAARATIVKNADKLGAVAGNKVRKFAGYGVDDMFQETATFFTKERGVYDINKAQRFLAGKNKVISAPSIVAKPMEWLFDNFDKGWQAPAEINQQIQLMQVGTSQLMAAKTRHFESIFEKAGLFTEKSRSQIVTSVERRAAGVFDDVFDDATEAAIVAFRKGLDDIAEYEKGAGYPLEEIEDYVTHIASPGVKRMYTKIMEKNGQEILSGQANKYIKHRAIASIAEGEDIYGTGAFITDPLEILKRRQRASIDMVAKGDLFKYVMEKYSLPQAIVHASFVGNSAAKNVVVGMIRRISDGPNEIMNIGQVYAARNGALSKLGFKEGDLFYNRNLLGFLSKKTTERVGDNLYNEAARFHYKAGADGLNSPIPDRFKFNPGKLSSMTDNAPELADELPVETMMNMFADPKHEKWKDIFATSVGRTKGDVNRAVGLLQGFHRFTMENLDSQLTGFIPDVEQRVMAAWTHHAREAQWITSGKAAGIKKALANMSTGFEFKNLVPQLPESLVVLAHATRRMIGNIVDTAEPLATDLNHLDTIYAKLGFTSENIAQHSYIMLGHKNGVQYQADVDIILDSLEQYTHASPTLNHAGELVDAATKGTGRQRKYDARAADRLVEWTFTSTRKYQGNFLPEMNDLDRGVSTIEGVLDKTSQVARRIKPEPGEIADAEMLLVDRAAVSATTRAPHSTEKGTAALEGRRGALDFINDKRARVNEALKGHVAALKKKELLDELLESRKREIAAETAAREFKIAQRGLEGYKDAAAKLKVISKRVKEVKAQVKTTQAEVKSLTPAGDSYADLLKQSKELNKAQREHLSELAKTRNAEATTDGVTSSGILGEPNIIDKLTPADKVRRLREASAASPDDVGLKNQLTAAIEDQHRLARGIDAPPIVQTGLNRLESKTITHKVYIPEGVAKVLKDLEAPDLPEGMSEWARSAIRNMDAFQNYLKLQMTLPFAGYYGRNALQAAQTTALRTGVDFLDPTDGFSNGADMLSGVAYGLLRYGEGDKLFGWSVPRTKKFLEGFGDRVVTARSGRSMTLRELDEQMSIRGIHHGMQSSEMFGAMPVATRFKGALNGVMAGATLGGIGGAVVGQAGVNAGLLDQDNQFAEYSALMGAVALGIKGRGIPVAGKRGVAGLLQSDWKPFIRPGEAATEMPFRVALFMNEFKRSGSASEAAEQVYRHMNNYHSMSVFERRFMRRAIPFYSWTKLALRHTAFQTLEDPGKIATVFKFFKDWNSSAHVDPEDMPDSLDEKLALTSKNSSLYAKAKDWDVVGKFLSDPEKKRKGSVVNVAGFGSALEDASAMMSAVLPGADNDSDQFLRHIASRGSFVPMRIAEVLVQRDFYTGRDLDAPANADEWASSPAWLKEIVGYSPAQAGVKKASINNPTMAWVMNKIPHGRMIGLLKTVYEMDGETRKGLDTWQLSKNFLGISAYKTDTTTGKYYINKGRIDALSNLLQRIQDVDSGSAPNMGRYRQSKKSGRLSF
jgi:hypothetical protein